VKRLRTNRVVDRRPLVCPGCQAALIRGRRARPGRFCPDCLREKVKAREVRG